MRERKRKGGLRRTIAVAGVGLAALVATTVGMVAAAVIAVLTVYDTDDLKQFAASAASRAIGRQIAINGDAALHLGRVSRVHLEDVVVANAAWSRHPHMLELASLDVAIDIPALFRGTFEFPSIALTSPHVVLEKNARGEPNWQFSPVAKQAARQAAPDTKQDIPIVRSMRIRDARIAYGDPTIDRSAAVVVDDLTLREADDRKVTLDASGSYAKQPLRLRFRGGSWDDLRNGTAPYPLDLKAVVADLQVAVDGAVGDPARLESVDVHIDVKGDNAANLFPLTGLVIPPTPPYQATGTLTRKGSEWRLSDMSGAMGDSDVRGTITINPGRDPLYASADVVSSRLDFKDLGPVIGLRPGGQQGEAEAAAHTPANANGRVLPDKEIKLPRLKAMNADVSFDAKRIEAAPYLPLDRLTAKLQLQDGVIRLQPAEIGIGNGSIRTVLSLYGDRQPPRVDIATSVRNVDMKQLLRSTSFAAQASGTLGGQVKLSATGSSVADILGSSSGDLFVVMAGGTISHLLIEAAGLDIAEALGVAVEGDNPIPVRCIVADLHADQGVFTSRALVVDTTDTNIVGTTTIDMRKERIDMTVYPTSKDFSPLSVRAPISIQGRFADPSIFPDPAGIGVDTTVKKVIDAVLTPIIGLLPPIDAGVGEDSDCAGLIQRAENNRRGAKP